MDQGEPRRVLVGRPSAVSVQGRGAIVVDTTIRPTGAGNPFTYLAQAEVNKTQDHEAQRIVQEYDPHTEMVIVLFKQEGRISVYRCRPVG